MMALNCQIRSVEKEMEQTLSLATRKLSVLKSIEAQESLTKELTAAILDAKSLQKATDFPWKDLKYPHHRSLARNLTP